MNVFILEGLFAVILFAIWLLFVDSKKRSWTLCAGTLLLVAILTFLYSFLRENEAPLGTSLTLLMQHVYSLTSPFLVILLIRAWRKGEVSKKLPLLIATSQASVGLYVLACMIINHGLRAPVWLPINKVTITIILLTTIPFPILCLGLGMFVLVRRNSLRIQWYPALLVWQGYTLVMVWLVRL